MTFNGITGYRGHGGRYQKFDRAALFRVISTQKHFGPGPLSPNHVFYRAGLHSLAIILTLALVSKSKVLSANTTIEHSKGLGGTI